MADDAPEIAEIIEMSEAESAWTLWSGSQAVETFGLCDCGHEGLGPSWHVRGCRGAYEALWRRARELTLALAEQWQAAHEYECQAHLADGECELGEGCLWPKPY